MPWQKALLSELAEQLQSSSDTLATELSPCGSKHVQKLHSVAQVLLDHPSPDAPARSSAQLDDLIEAAHSSMASSPPQKSLCWRRLYTEASLLRALVEIVFWDCSEPHVKKAIVLLDHILVVAGAPGEGRYDLVIFLISKIQTDYLPSPPFNITRPDDPGSRPTTNVPLMASTGSVPRLDSLPSFTQFKTHLHRQPFILSGYARDWPAMTDRPWQSFAYLRSVSGRGRVVPIEVGGDYRADDWSHRMMEWDHFLDRLENEQKDHGGTAESGKGDTSVMYLAQHNLLSQFPSLRDDIVVPDYVYSCPPAPPDYPDYRPPGNDDQLVVNAWLGPKGTISPAHTDPYYNFYAQIVGSKTVWLAPPAISTSMYPYPPSISSTSSTDTQAHNNPASNNVEPSMSNTSRVDVFDETPHEHDRDTITFPAFWDNVVPRAQNATLHPGDVLFFPPGWWHAMRSEETSFSVSMWF